MTAIPLRIVVLEENDMNRSFTWIDHDPAAIASADMQDNSHLMSGFDSARHHPR
jgi:hypothetical protein